MADSKVSTPDQTGLQNPFDSPAVSTTPIQTGLDNPFELSKAAQGGVSSDSGSSSATQPSSIEEADKFIMNATSPIAIGAGLLKGVGDTVGGVGTLIRKGANLVHPGLGDKIVPPEGSAALDQVSAANGPGQYVGKAMENVLEFMGGEGVADEGAKALSLGDKFSQLGDIGKFLEKHEVLAKMLATGAKTGAVTATQTTAKTGSPIEGAEAGAVGAAGGAALEGVGAGVGAVRNLYKNATDVTTVQPVIQKGIRDVLSEVAKDNGVPKPSSSSVRDVVSDVADGVKKKSQTIFQRLDTLSNGDFSDAQADAARYKGSLDKAGKDAYQEALNKQDAIFDQYKNQFQPGVLDQAKANWKQYRALQDVDNAIKMTTTGSRPAITAGSAAKQPAETVNPKQLLKRLNNLYNDGTLQTAVGEDKAHELLDHAGAAAGRVETIAAHNKTLSTVAKAAPYVGVTGLAGYAAKKALSGTQGH